jgi:hypothetical protein
MQTYKITITGETPLLMHHDNLKWAETMKLWEMDPANKPISVKGDDRSPAWRWIGNLYVENNKIVIPADNLMTVLREGGTRTPTGQGAKTFKAQTQSGLVVDQSSWPILIGGNTIAYDPVKALIQEADFALHELQAQDLGFNLFVKRAKIGQAKHVRVRPRFDSWSCSGSITVFDTMITRDILATILTYAGNYAGLGDWRPSSPRSPGPFGKFTVTVGR